MYNLTQTTFYPLFKAIIFLHQLALKKNGLQNFFCCFDSQCAFCIWGKYTAILGMPLALQIGDSSIAY